MNQSDKRKFFLHFLEAEVQGHTDDIIRVSQRDGVLCFEALSGYDVLTISSGDAPRLDKKPNPWFSIGPKGPDGVPTREARRLWEALSKGLEVEQFDQLRKILGMEVGS